MKRRDHGIVTCKVSMKNVREVASHSREMLMLFSSSSRKPTTRKGKKALEEREPKTIENLKKTLIMEGRKCSNEIRQALKDLNLFKKPNSRMMRRNNDVTPFEDATPLEQ